MNNISKQETHRGIVTSYRPDKFGFIESEHGSNVWFGQSATQGLDFLRGDEVKFALSTKQDPRGKSAYRVWLVKRAVPDDDREQITTLRGKFET